MASIIYGDGNVLNAMLYGAPHPAVKNYLEQVNYQQQHNLTYEGRAFLDRSLEYIESITDHDALRVARAAMRMSDNLWHGDSVRALRDIGEIQQAPTSMMRWVMAQPYVRSCYHKQLCDGYSGEYIDYYPNQVGEEHVDYQIVMNGLFEDTPDGMVATTYMSDAIDEEQELSLDEQIDIQQITWTEVERLMRKKKEDPVSRYNASL